MDKPQIAPLEYIPIPEVENYVLHHQVPLLLLNDDKREVVRAEFIFSIEGQSYVEVSEVGNLLFSGTKTKTAEQISGAFEQLGAYTDVQVNRDYLTLTVYSLGETFYKALELAEEVFSEACFPAREWEIQKGTLFHKIEVDEKKTSVRAQRAFLSHLYPDHVYGEYATREKVETFDSEHFQQVFRHIISQLQLITVTGDISEQHITYIDRMVSGWQNEKAPSFSALPHIKESIHLPDPLPEAQQASLRIGCKSIRRDHEDYFAWSFLNNLLGGYFGSRLMKNIREEKGWTYGIYSRLVHLRYDSYFVIAADVKKTMRQQAIDEVFSEVKKLSQLKVTEAELSTLSNYLKGNYMSSIATIFDVMDRHKSLHLNKLPSNYYKKYFDSLDDISAGDVISTALKYLDADKMLILYAE